ncbi:MAG: tetratricopeptide repeat protein [Halofilum sp. (in: g-proteobacteria)]|nr:tetratricopeptide repeat protein [Halofilum sp. (in: g-proteobacteria)]
MLETLKASESREVRVSSAPLRATAFERGGRAGGFEWNPLEEQGGDDLSSAPKNVVWESKEQDLPLRWATETFLSGLLAQWNRFKDSAGYLLKLAQLSNDLGLQSKAIEYAQRSVELSEHAVYRQYLADLLWEAGDRYEAKCLYSHEAELGYIPSILRLAESAVAEGRISEGESYARIAEARDPLDWRVNMVSGAFALRRADPAAAVQKFREALQERQKSPTLRLNLAIAHYWLGNSQAALKQTRIAISLNPFYERALIFLADLSEALDSDSAIPERKLSNYVDMFGFQPDLVDRLTRIYVETGKNLDGIDLLERFKSEFSDSGLLNNLGVLWTSRKRSVAIRYFSEAIRHAEPADSWYEDRGACIAAVNLAWSLIENQEARKAKDIAWSFVQGSPNRKYFGDRTLSKITSALVRSLTECNEVERAITIGEEFFCNPHLHPETAIDIGNALISLSIWVKNDPQDAVEYAKRVYELSETIGDLDERRWVASRNNLIFALAECGYVDEAKRILTEVIEYVGNHEYVTATAGLIAFREGNAKRGEELYRSAIARASDRVAKSEFKAKLALELSRSLLEVDGRRKASRELRHAVSAPAGGRKWVLKGIENQAKRISKAIKRG